MGKFVVRMSAAGFHFVLKAGNGEIIGTSESYTAKPACLNGIASVRTNAPVAALEDQTAGGAEEKNPRFEVYVDRKGEYRFRLTAKNGEKILASEGYKTKPACLGGVESVRRNAPDAEVTEE